MGGSKTEVCEDEPSSEIEGYQIIYIKEENLEDDWREDDITNIQITQSSLQQGKWNHYIDLN